MKKSSTYNHDTLPAALAMGREDAFDEIFRELYPALCFYGAGITGNQAASEDIASASFLKIWEKRLLFKQWNALKSYLYTTVRNASIDWLKKEQRLPVEGDDLMVTAPAEERLIIERIIEAELLREIYRAIDTLPAQCRKVIKMTFIDGKSSQEIADHLQLSVSSIRNQKARGLGILRKLVHLPALISAFLYSL